MPGLENYDVMPDPGSMPTMQLNLTDPYEFVLQMVINTTCNKTS